MGEFAVGPVGTRDIVHEIEAQFRLVQEIRPFRTHDTVTVKVNAAIQ